MASRDKTDRNRADRNKADKEQRNRLLDEVFEQPAASLDRPTRFSPELISEITMGLVFAQRPIAAAGEVVTARYDLGPRGAFMLSLIDRGVHYPNDLAKVLRIGRSLVTSELARLTEAGLVEAEAGEDRRRTLLALTPAGRVANSAFRNGIVDHIERALGRYTPEEVRLFTAMLLAVQETARS